MFKIIIFLLILISLWRLIKSKKTDWLMLIFLFLGFLALYNLYLGVNWSMGLIMLGVLAISGLVYYLLIDKPAMLSYLFLILIAILELELFLTLIPWPIDPKGKSLILTTSFYFFASMVKLKEENNLDWKKTVSILMLAIIIAILVILTTQWYQY